MNPNPTIVQFESDDYYLTIVDLICFEMGLKVSKIASSSEQARVLLEEIAQSKVKPDIAIISGILSRNHQDGEFTAKKLREISPDTKIIAYTILDDVEWGDLYAHKSATDNKQTITLALEELTGIKYKANNISDPEE